jgi:hypothetical protein
MSGVFTIVKLSICIVAGGFLNKDVISNTMHHPEMFFFRR